MIIPKINSEPTAIITTLHANLHSAADQSRVGQLPHVQFCVVPHACNTVSSSGEEVGPFDTETLVHISSNEHLYSENSK